jgi:hypothetical protein
MSDRTTSHRGRVFLAVSVAFALSLVLGLIPAMASHGDVSLPGSNFEIDTDANLKVDHTAPPSLDWANVTEVRKQDTASGPTDESFGQGTKEDTANPTVVNGSIPPNKSDLKFFGLFQEGDDFLHLFWSRVQDPSGTTNMDFEFNQNKCDPANPDDSVCAGNGITPARTAGDLLVTYDLSRGGTVPTLSLREWTGTQWGPAVNLTGSGDATGSINTSTIPAGESDGLGAQDPRTFGEASIDLAAITDPTGCTTFGSAYLKSRASDSFTAALKDFVPPAAIDIGRCGSIEITKVDDDDPANPLEGAVFTLWEDVDPADADTEHDPAEDVETDLTCTTGSDGICTITGVLAGDYWVVETTGVPGHDLAPDQHATVVADEEIQLTFVNPRQLGAIQITKTAKQASEEDGSIPLGGVTFTIEGGDLPDGGTAVVTDAVTGVACLDGLAFATDYTVTETEPTNYNAVGDGVQEATVDNKAACDDEEFVGEELTFDNVPLTDFEVSVDSLVVGGTDTQIDCVDADDASVATGNTADATGDTTAGQVVASDLEPGIYTCTINIDP